MKPPQSRGGTALLSLPPTHTHTYWCETHTFTTTHTQNILLHELILYISWYVWYCGVNVVSCYDAVVGVGWRGIFGFFGWDRGGSVSSVTVTFSLSLSLFYLVFFEGRCSLCYLSLVRLSWLKNWKKKTNKKKTAVSLELITSTFLTITCLCCRLNPDSFLLRQYNMCLVLADSHVYKVHICVHMCNTRYSSNLLLWLLLMMILVPFFSRKFQPVFFFLLVLISCRWIVLQELKKGKKVTLVILHTQFHFRGFADI